MKRYLTILALLMLVLSCEEIDPESPDEPFVEYKAMSYYLVEDELGNMVLTGRLAFDFTDGDGNIGIPALKDETDTTVHDTLKYNFFLQLYDFQDSRFVKIPEEKGGVLKYRIPAIDKNPTKGQMELDISYPIIIYDTIFYTFFIMDGTFNRSNTDTTDIQDLSAISFPDDEDDQVQ